LNNGWDVENRMVQSVPDQLQGGISWTYDPWGKRIWKTVPNATGSGTSTQCEFYFYGITGQRLETWSCGYNDSNGGDGSYWSSVKETYSYFGRRLIKINDWVAVDRLGSVRSTGSGAERIAYYPWGEERTTTADGRIKFGTYVRDSGPNGQDYADQRYYNSGSGRFTTPDPSTGVNLGDPTSWNKYSYVGGDPINFNDPSGLNRLMCDVYTDYGCAGSGSNGTPGVGWFVNWVFGEGGWTIGTAGFFPGDPIGGSGGGGFVQVQPKVPGGNNYTPAQMQALTNGLNNALSHTDQVDCATFYAGGDEDPSLATANVLENPFNRYVPICILFRTQVCS